MAVNQSDLTGKKIFGNRMDSSLLPSAAYDSLVATASSDKEADLLNQLIAERIKSLLAERRSKGEWIKHSTLASAMEIDPTVVTKLLEGRSDGTRPMFNVAYLRKFGNFLGVSMNYLLPSEAEVQSGKLEPREASPELLGPGSSDKALRPELLAFLKRHGRDIPPRAREALELSNPLPGSGEDADDFYWKIVKVVSVDPPATR